MHRGDANREGAPASPAVATAVSMNSKERHESPLGHPGAASPTDSVMLDRNPISHRACGNLFW